LLLDCLTWRRGYRPGVARATALVLVLIVAFWAFTGGFLEISPRSAAGDGGQPPPVHRERAWCPSRSRCALLPARRRRGHAALLFACQLIYGVSQVAMGIQARRIRADAALGGGGMRPELAAQLCQ